MYKKIHHLGIAVNDLEKAASVLKDAFNLEVSGVEEVPSQQVKVAFVPIGETRLELLEPTSEDSAVAKFLAKRGEGFHHVAFETDAIEDALKACRKPRAQAYRQGTQARCPRHKGGLHSP